MVADGSNKSDVFRADASPGYTHGCFSHEFWENWKPRQGGCVSASLGQRSSQSGRRSEWRGQRARDRSITTLRT
jgi:hypothetical protein